MRRTHELWKRLPDKVCYGSDYAQAGFHKVHLTDFTHWHEIHEWCAQQFGRNYTWTGSSFWFTTEEDATEFTLTWC